MITTQRPRLGDALSTGGRVTSTVGAGVAITAGAIQAGLLFHLLAVLFGVALAGLGHIPYLQIFDAHDRVVWADGG